MRFSMGNKAAIVRHFGLPLQNKAQKKKPSALTVALFFLT